MKGVIIGVGNLGTHLMNYLSKNYELSLIDKEPIANPKGRVFTLDVTTASVSDLEAAIEGSGFLIYTAWHNPDINKDDPTYVREYAAKAKAVHVDAARKIYMIARRLKVPKVIDISTMSVFYKPDWSKIPNLTEEHTPDSTGWAYAETKLEGERVLESIATFQTQGIVLRLLFPLDDERFKKAPSCVCTHYDDITHAVERAILADIPYAFRVYHISNLHPKNNVMPDRAINELGYKPQHLPQGR